jgi:hypothetical protein
VQILATIRTEDGNFKNSLHTLNDLQEYLIMTSDQKNRMFSEKVAETHFFIFLLLIIDIIFRASARKVKQL